MTYKKSVIALAEKLFIKKSYNMQYGNTKDLIGGARALTEACLIWAEVFYDTVEEEFDGKTKD